MRTWWLNSKKCLTVSSVFFALTAFAVPKPPKLLSPAQQIRQDIRNQESSNNLNALFTKWRKSFPQAAIVSALSDLAQQTRADTSARATAILGYGKFATANPSSAEWLRPLTQPKNPWLIRLTAMQSYIQLNEGRWPAAFDPLLKDRAEVIREEARRLRSIALKTLPPAEKREAPAN